MRPNHVNLDVGFLLPVSENFSFLGCDGIISNLGFCWNGDFTWYRMIKSCGVGSVIAKLLECRC